ncbi:PilZ domain-containing protein [Brevibacillus choshinensis]|uniref:PilZ domain-containing protein n=1 Tax=Brevibacillus choshinensis TaxID=54911 RepID=A0ABX7FV55_BRECH|nr:PilZ domain-containing protein [Brevibacillus choshinensis]QRG69414.1 PilZ domain-containing protein [Brevibacillus choshinensis]
MTDVPSLTPFLTDKRLQRGAVLPMMISKQVKTPVQVMVEHVKSGYLVVSTEVKAETRTELIGSTVRIRWETESAINTIDLEVVQEQMLWPIKLLGLIPIAIGVEIASSAKRGILPPDTMIKVPYKVMGARPIEEKGEAVLLKFSPTRLMLGTEGYVSKGDFLHLSFVIPHQNVEVVGMAKVVEKTFQDTQAVLELIFTDIHDKHHQQIKDYYKKLSTAASS